MTIIERIQELLNARELTAVDLCNKTGIKYATYNAWKARGTNPGAEYIAPIAEYFGVPDHYILTGEDNSDPQETHPISGSTKLLVEYWDRLNELGRARALVSVYDLLRDAENTEQKQDEYDL